MRKNYNTSAAQRTRQQSNREFRMALKADEMEPFGIRRRLTFESQRPILEAFRLLIDDGMITDRIEPRSSLHVTEMPKLQISKQLSQGIVIGYELGRKSVRARQEITDAFSSQVIVRLGEAAVFKQRNIGYRVHNEELETEYHDVRLAMGRIGVKGTMRDVEPLHVTCGNIPNGVRRSEIFRSIDAMNELLDVEAVANVEDRGLFYIPSEVTLDPIEFYPGEY